MEEASSPRRYSDHENDTGKGTRQSSPYRRSASRSPANSARSSSRTLPTSNTLSGPRIPALAASQYTSPSRIHHTAASSYMASRSRNPTRHSQAFDTIKDDVDSSEPYQMYTSPPASRSPPMSPRHESPPISPRSKEYAPHITSNSPSSNVGVGGVKRLPMYTADGSDRAGMTSNVTHASILGTRRQSLSPRGRSSYPSPSLNGRFDGSTSPRTTSPRASSPPKSIRETDRSVSSPLARDTALTPTELHAACASRSSSIGKLKATLLAQGTPAASHVNSEGQTPLHILGRNELLIQLFMNQAKYEEAGTVGLKGLADHMSFVSSNGSVMSVGGDVGGRGGMAALEGFIVDLVKSYPRAAITSDSSGHIPFTNIITEWINNACSNDLDDDDFSVNASTTPVTVSIGRQSSVDGIEQVGESERAVTANRNQRSRSRVDQEIRFEDDRTLGSRSLFTNITLPTAFRSVYNSSHGMPGGSSSRATYRKVSGFPRTQGNPSAGSVFEENPSRPKGAIRGISNGKPDKKVSGWQNGNKATIHDEHTLMYSDENLAYNDMGKNNYGNKENENVSSENSGCSIDDFFPLNVRMPAMVEWSLRILSIILNSFALKDDLKRIEEERAERLGISGMGKNQNMAVMTTSGDNDWIGNTLVSAVASVPSLMKTLLLMDDQDPVKARVFNLPIVRRILSSRYTVGNWLVYMLEAVDLNVARRAVDYLVILSNDEDDMDNVQGRKGTRHLGPSKPIASVGASLTVPERKDLYNKISKLSYFLPALLALEDTSEVDRAASTRIIRHILDEELSLRRSKIITFFDFFFHILLIVTFQVGTNYFISNGSDSSQYTITFYLSLSAILYHLVRKMGQFSSLVKISTDACMNNTFRWLDMIDWVAMGLVLGGIIWTDIEIHNGPNIDENSGQVIVSDGMRSYLAASTCAVWTKMMVWFYIVNWDMTMFLRAMSQVIHDIRWFLFFLIVAILAAAQMFYVMLSREYPCDEGGFCDQKNAYLEVYAIVLGQFATEDFSTTFSVIVFCIFSFLVLIVLAFMLIPIVIDSYTKTMTLRAERAECGVRARLVYVGEISAFRRLVEGRWSLLQYCSAILFISSTSVIFMFSAAEIRESLDDYYGNTILPICISTLLIFLFLSIAAFVSNMTYYEKSDPGFSSTSYWNRFIDSSFVRFLASPIDALMSFLLGLDKDVLAKKGANQWDDWHGGVSHVRSDVRQLMGSSESRTLSLVHSEVNELESRMLKSSERVRTDVLTEIRSSEERLEKMITVLQNHLAGKDTLLGSSLSAEF